MRASGTKLHSIMFFVQIRGQLYVIAALLTSPDPFSRIRSLFLVQIFIQYSNFNLPQIFLQFNHPSRSRSASRPSPVHSLPSQCLKIIYRFFSMRSSHFILSIFMYPATFLHPILSLFHYQFVFYTFRYPRFFFSSCIRSILSLSFIIFIVSVAYVIGMIDLARR